MGDARCGRAEPDGSDFEPIDASLTVGDELDKLAWNLALGRAFAGVQWRSDAEAGLRLGEAVAVALLRELRDLLPEPTAPSRCVPSTATAIEI